MIIEIIFRSKDRSVLASGSTELNGVVSFTRLFEIIKIKIIELYDQALRVDMKQTMDRHYD